jgi:hypothetical protein
MWMPCRVTYHDARVQAPTVPLDKGFDQVFRLLGRKIIKPHLTVRKRHGLLHLSGYLCHPMMVVILLLTLPLLLWGVDILQRLTLGWSGSSAWASLYISSQVALYGNGWGDGLCGCLCWRCWV